MKKKSTDKNSGTMLPGMTGKNNFVPTFVAFDLETTGFDANTDAIVEIGALRFTYDKAGDLKILDEYSQLINPGVEVPVETEMITGIKTEDLVGQPTLTNVISEVEKFLNLADFVVGHNVSFDVSFIDRLFKLKPPQLDSQFFAEVFFPGLSSYSLDVLPHELGLNRGRAHRAYDDARVSAEVFLSALRQYAALEDGKQNLANLFAKAGLAEEQILTGFRENTNKVFKAWKPAKEIKTDLATHKELSKAININLKTLGKKIITHPALANASLSILKTACEYYRKDGQRALLIGERTNGWPIVKDCLTLESPEKLICVDRLHNAFNREVLSRSEGVIAVKLLVSEKIDNNFSFWPKFSSQEKKFLTHYYFQPDLCASHVCSTFIKIEGLKKFKGPILATHDAFWKHPAEISAPQTTVVLTDFDEAVEHLTKLSEIKISLDFLPEILAALPAEVKNLEDNKREVLDKNDLFWGLMGLEFKDELEQGQVHITPQRQDEVEFKKITSPAKKIVLGLANLVDALENSGNDYAVSFGRYIAVAVIPAFSAIAETSKDYYFYLDQWNGQVSLRLTPHFQSLGRKFRDRVGENALLTAATGSDNITAHYANLLGINDWPVEFVNIKRDRAAELFVVYSALTAVEAALQILLANDGQKAVIVAKNSREISLYAEHLKRNLGENRAVLYLTSSGSGANKALYQFAQSQNAVLVIPPRGRILHAPWPPTDLAILTTIPFPVPEPGLGFMDHGLPKAMLAYKTLINKVLQSGSENVKLFMIDGRLLSAQYGKNFIQLAEQICGCEAKVENL